VSYHPGVMMTDLWRPGSGHQTAPPASAPGSASSSRPYVAPVGLAMVRCLVAPLVKHPHISGAGLAALADPRCCAAPFLSAPPGQCCACRHVGTALLGSGGGYYQQACCATLVPVRATLPLAAAFCGGGGTSEGRDESGMLWDATVDALERTVPALAATARAFLEPEGVKRTSLLVQASWPCTEWAAAAPMCVCCSCLC
jgi:hypothetical protein